MNFKTTLLTVFVMPKEFSAKFCFGGSVAQTFTMVDWFEAPEEITKEQLQEFLSKKPYYKGNKLLIIGRNDMSFVIRGDKE